MANAAAVHPGAQRRRGMLSDGQRPLPAPATPARTCRSTNGAAARLTRDERGRRARSGRTPAHRADIADPRRRRSSAPCVASASRRPDAWRSANPAVAGRSRCHAGCRCHQASTPPPACRAVTTRSTISQPMPCSASTARMCRAGPYAVVGADGEVQLAVRCARPGTARRRASASETDRSGRVIASVERRACCACATSGSDPARSDPSCRSPCRDRRAAGSPPTVSTTDERVGVRVAAVEEPVRPGVEDQMAAVRRCARRSSRCRAAGATASARRRSRSRSVRRAAENPARVLGRPARRRATRRQQDRPPRRGWPTRRPAARSPNRNNCPPSSSPMSGRRPRSSAIVRRYARLLARPPASKRGGRRIADARATISASR